MVAGPPFIGLTTNNFFLVGFDQSGGDTQAVQSFYAVDTWINSGTTGLNEDADANYASFSAIPEPGTALLMGLGLAGLGAVGRSRREETRRTA